MNKGAKDLIYFGVNRWDSMLQREQHLIMGLSHTYRILFIDPPLSVLTILQGNLRGERWRFQGRLQWKNDQLAVYTPPAFPPFSQYFEWVNSFHSGFLISMTKRLAEKLKFKDFIVGIGRPFIGRAIQELNPSLSYYDCSDDYSEFPGLKINRALLKKKEEEVLKCIDLVFCSSQMLKEAKSAYNQNCFLIPNGVDLFPFRGKASGAKTRRDMETIKRPVLGYVGTIGDWFDSETLISLALERPDWSIVLIGPVTSKRFASIFTGAPNIYWLGERDSKEIPEYLATFNVCLIPFKVNEFTKKIYPTKFHEYMGAGKPVVSSQLPDLESFVPWVRFYVDLKGMERSIDELLKGDSDEKAQERRNIASENTWDRRVESMIHVFNKFLKKEIPPQLV